MLEVFVVLGILLAAGAVPMVLSYLTREPKCQWPDCPNIATMRGYCWYPIFSKT